jgi:hypothetical protein
LLASFRLLADFGKTGARLFMAQVPCRSFKRILD